MSDVIPARRLVRRDPASSVTFTHKQRDRAYKTTVERYVAWARELLNETPCVLDNDVIRERRVEAAAAVLDVLWSVMAEKAAMDGDPHPVPGLIWHHFAEEEREQLALPAS